MDIPSSLIDQFVMLTNADPSVASQLLGDNALDIEAAIASFFAIQEAGGAPVAPAPQHQPGTEDTADGAGAAAAAAASLAADEAFARSLQAEAPAPEAEVRAPIPDRIDQLLPGGGGGPGAPRGRRAHTVDDPFLQNETGSRHGAHLAAIFRPPVDLVSRDDFDQAMAKGISEKKWLLVNMQKTGNFSCLVLNRDVWSDTAVRALVESRFIFWQRDEDTDDGRRYKQFYSYDNLPHVAVIDPRSGERLRVFGEDGLSITKDFVINALVDFCDAQNLEDDGASSSRAVARVSAARTRGEGARSAPGAVVDLDKDRMETEDAQIAAAIAASMSGGSASGAAGAANGDGDDDDDDDVMVTGGNLPTNSVTADRRTSQLMSATDPSLNHDRSLIAEQDSAYQQSLEMDRAKKESEKAEADRAERAQVEESERVNRAASAAEEKRQRLPSPPPPGCTESTTELLIRLPSGGRLQRRFYVENTIGDVYDFVDLGTDELENGGYNLIIPMPRVAFEDRSVTLSDAELRGRAMLVVDKK